jgi:hypothetical protein
MQLNNTLLEFMLPLLIWAVVANLCSFAVIWILSTKIPLRREIWLPLSFITGPLALLLFVIWAVYSGSLAHTMEMGERHKIERVLRQLSTRGKDHFDPVLEYGLDDYLEKLISQGRFADAQNYVNERLKIAHERDNKRSEKVYREYQLRVEEALKSPLGEGQA